MIQGWRTAMTVDGSWCVMTMTDSGAVIGGVNQPPKDKTFEDDYVMKDCRGRRFETEREAVNWAISVGLDPEEKTNQLEEKKQKPKRRKWVRWVVEIVVCILSLIVGVLI